MSGPKRLNLNNALQASNIEEGRNIMKEAIENSNSSKKETPSKGERNFDDIMDIAPKKVLKTFYLNENNIIQLEKYLSLQHARTGKRVTSSSVMDKLLADYVKDLDVNV